MEKTTCKEQVKFEKSYVKREYYTEFSRGGKEYRRERERERERERKRVFRNVYEVELRKKEVYLYSFAIATCESLFFIFFLSLV